jgi:hypothetical protein
MQLGLAINDGEDLRKVIGAPGDDIFPIRTPSQIVDSLLCSTTSHSPSETIDQSSRSFIVIVPIQADSHNHPLFLPKFLFMCLFFLLIFPESGDISPTFDLVPDDDRPVYKRNECHSQTVVLLLSRGRNPKFKQHSTDHHRLKPNTVPSGST